MCVCVWNVQPPGMVMSPVMRGMNAGGYYPGPYDVSHALFILTAVSVLKML